EIDELRPAHPFRAVWANEDLRIPLGLFGHGGELFWPFVRLYRVINFPTYVPNRPLFAYFFDAYLVILQQNQRAG
ncbi:MAG: hypothetical protein ACKO6M_01050, partial [Bacteroidota bacterium]